MKNYIEILLALLFIVTGIGIALFYLFKWRSLARKGLWLYPFYKQALVHFPGRVIFRNREGKILDDSFSFSEPDGNEIWSFSVENMVDNGVLKQFDEVVKFPSGIRYNAYHENIGGELMIHSQAVLDSVGCAIGVMDHIHPSSSQMAVDKELEAVAFTSQTYQTVGERLTQGRIMDAFINDKSENQTDERRVFIDTILGALPFHINVVDKNGDIKKDGVFETNAPSPPDLLNEKVEINIRDIIAEESHEMAQTVIQQVIDGGEIADLEVRILPMDPPRWFESRLVRISNAEALVFSREITERKHYEAKGVESELLFRSLFDMGNIAMGVLESDLSFSLINSRLFQLIGVEDGLVTTLNWSQIIIPEDIDYDKLVFQRVEQGLVNAYQGEKRLVKSDGTTVFTHFTLFLLKNEYLQTFKFVVSFIDISDRMELERRVLNTMIDTEEKERVRISRELHDGVGPLLSSLKMYLQWMQMKDSKSNKEELMADAEVLIDQTQQTIRDISFNLSPHLLQNYGLVVALNSFIDKIKGVGKIQFQLNVHGINGRLGDEIEVVLYRAVTECINNTLKYADALTVNMDMCLEEDVLVVVYKDNGVGFDADEMLSRKTGMGLFNMQSRLKAVNGKVHFKSRKGSGCHIEIVIKI